MNSKRFIGLVFIVVGSILAFSSVLCYVGESVSSAMRKTEEAESVARMKSVRNRGYRGSKMPSSGNTNQRQGLSLLSNFSEYFLQFFLSSCLLVVIGIYLWRANKRKIVLTLDPPESNDSKNAPVD